MLHASNMEKDYACQLLALTKCEELEGEICDGIYQQAPLTSKSSDKLDDGAVGTPSTALFTTSHSPDGNLGKTADEIVTDPSPGLQLFLAILRVMLCPHPSYHHDRQGRGNNH